MSVLSENLKRLRKEKGKTQLQMSQETGISEKAISRYERGESEPDAETLKTLADYLETTLDLMLGRKSQVQQSDDRFHYWKQKIWDLTDVPEHEKEEMVAYLEYRFNRLKDEDKQG